MQRLSIVVVVALIASALGFRAAPRAARSSGLAAGKSQALPFLPMPAALEGVPNTNGFDPVGFTNVVDIKWLREVRRVSFLPSRHPPNPASSSSTFDRPS
jgi:hypothetical protein